MDLCSLGAVEIAARYRSRELSPVEVIHAVADRVRETQPLLNAFTTTCLETALDDAARWEKAFAEGRPAAILSGVPYAAKDLFDTAGIRTTSGSALDHDRVPSRDAPTVARLRRAGAILVGKTGTHEFGWGITCANPHFGPVRNPWDPRLSSGGSSGGSAAAVAAGCVPIALGSDTGGSVRIPAAFCGVMGFKPTHGRIDSTGLTPLAPSLDHPGALARDPADLCTLFAAMDDSAPPDGPGLLDGIRVVVARGLHPVALGPAQERALATATGVLAQLGARVREVRGPDLTGMLDAFGVIQRAEALAAHIAAGRVPTMVDGYGPDVRARMAAAQLVTLDDYREATLVRERLRSEIGRLLERADMLLSVVAPCGPPEVGSDFVMHLGHERALRDVVMPTTAPQDLLGVPACALPAGLDDSGMPIGVQLTARAWRDEQLLGWTWALAEALPGLQGRPVAG